ncbi:MAG TPA: HlyD family efflux transporter periplasmic adaptor subunit [Candidatus Limnocylindria bacterium]|nr:HlyD family efflux transporter periplasmic adaptor subunit [Candidatus Limnocylindria bacterium]
MTTRRRSWRWKGLALVIVLLAGFYFSRGFFQRFQKTYPPTAFYHVKRADMLISIVEEGALRALNETVVRSGLEGFNRIIQLAPEGSYVQKGDLLVELDSSGLKDRLNEQELLHQERLFQMLQAKGNLNIQKSLVESQIKDAELRVENAQTDFEKYRDGDAPLLIKTVETRSGVLAEQARIARERYVRTEELFKAGNATRSEVEADALILKREQLALGQYQEDLRLIKKYDQPNQLRLLQSNVEQAKAELDRLKQRASNEIAQAEADLKTSQGALEYMEEGLDTLRERLKSTKILAPQNGLVVYASVSPFQSMGGGDRRLEEGRFRGGRGGEGGGGGGGRRGGRGNSISENSSRTGSSVSSVAETVAGGNQRIASAVSGSPATDSSATGGGNASSGGARPSSGGGTGGGQNASSAAGAFATYSSMRPSSLFAGSSAGNNSPAGSASPSASANAGAGAASSQSSTERQNSSFGNGNPFNSRSSQNFRDFGGFEMSGTPGVLEAGIMVRQRQELIRLPDVSKMLAEIQIEEARVGQVKAGMTAYIQVRNIPHRRFKGTVRRVALLPDAQASWMNPDKKVFPTDILVEEELPILKPGVSASVEVVITNLTQALSVPIQTVARWNGENVCFIKKGSRVTPVPVTTGWFNDAFVEIKSGLKEGDLVLLAPASDEEEEEDAEETESGATNHVEPAATPPRPQSVDEPPAEGRRFQRRNSEPSDGEATPERPRNRQSSGRRPQNLEKSSE